MYKALFRPLFFLLAPESAHHFTTSWFGFLLKFPGVKTFTRGRFVNRDPRLERQVFGLRFTNPVGLAPGFDKDARLYKDFAHLGFGFIEIGTVTPKGQSGNPQPRMFRLQADAGLINRMGFNNEGVEAAVERLRSRPAGLIVGGNIGKNKVTPNEEAENDYHYCFDALFEHVDYFVVNVSSPNTPNLRDLQDKEPLTKLLKGLMDRNKKKARPKPLLLKIAPDLTDGQLDDIIAIVAETGIDGIIATNTTISREGLKTDAKIANEAGGLSGKPLRERSTEVIRYLAEKSNHAFPIIGVGGIHSAEDAIEKLEAGASLVQLYTGFIYEGPDLIKRINEAILNHSMQ